MPICFVRLFGYFVLSSLIFDCFFHLLMMFEVKYIFISLFVVFGRFD